MKKIKKIGLRICCLTFCCITFCCLQNCRAQELKAHVSINTKSIQGGDNTLFTKLEQEMTAFLNERRWSNYQFKQEEKINCNVQLILDSKEGDNYSGRLIFQMSRPVFNSTYASNLLTIQDDDVTFPYSTSQSFDYDDNSFLWNLSSILGFYVNYALGIYFDSFSPQGGSPFFNQCQNIINYSQGKATGWTGNDSKIKRNRYWLWENVTNPSYIVFREFYYQYHRHGMDLLSSSLSKGVDNILASLKELQELNKTKSNLYLTSLILTSKSTEFINVFSGAAESVRREAKELLTQLDPVNASKYAKLE
ncbi:MAG: DUF4835 family protein [Bacteroidales bacterium]|nr:DUF4835 family protein [Bacteroidales bacterium]